MSMVAQKNISTIDGWDLIMLMKFLNVQINEEVSYIVKCFIKYISD